MSKKKDKIGTPVLDFLIVLVAVVGVLIGIWMVRGNQKEEAVEGSWQEFKMSLDGQEVSLPMPLEEFLSSVGCVNDGEDYSDSSIRQVCNKGGKTFQIITSGSLDTAKLIGINIYRMCDDGCTPNAEISICNKVKWGTTLEEAKEVLGEPSKEGSFTNISYLDYTKDDGSYLELHFDDFGLSTVKMLNKGEE